MQKLYIDNFLIPYLVKLEKLSSLQKLHLSNNNLKCLPQEITKLDNLLVKS